MNKLKFIDIDQQRRIYKIIDDNVMTLLGLWAGEIILAGGATQSIINPHQPINDYDLFFTNLKEVENVKEWLEYQGFEKTFECPAGELFSFKRKGIKVQLITKFEYTDIEHLLNSFDFRCCMVGLYMLPSPKLNREQWRFMTSKGAIQDIEKKRLRINVITFPVATLNRLTKYIKNKKYWADEQCLHDLVMEINSGVFNGDDLQMYVD
jgi:hypothetical protein